MAENQVGIFIACRNGLLRESLSRILNKKADFRVVGRNSTPPKSYAEMMNLGVDVVVLDSLQLLLEHEMFLPNRRPEVDGWRTILIAMEDDQQQLLTAIQYGVSGYVLREASAVEVVTAIRGVANGQAVCPCSMTRFLFDFVISQAPFMPNNRNRCRMSLTNREQQLIPLIGRGLTNKEIASELQLSEQTVKNHVHRILRKVGVEDRLSVFEAFQSKALGL